MRDDPGRAVILAAFAASFLLVLALSESDSASGQAAPAPKTRIAELPPRLGTGWSTAEDGCRFQQLGSPVSLSGGPGSVAAADAGWRNGNCSASRAEVSVRLQARHDGQWRDIGNAATDVLRGGGRTEVRFTCHNSLRTQWRSVVDVDLVDVSDEPQELRTPTRVLSCCPDPSTLGEPRS